jgi:hypothetical protein
MTTSQYIFMSSTPETSSQLYISGNTYSFKNFRNLITNHENIIGIRLVDASAFITTASTHNGIALRCDIHALNVQSTDNKGSVLGILNPSFVDANNIVSYTNTKTNPILNTNGLFGLSVYFQSSSGVTIDMVTLNATYLLMFEIIMK